MARTVTKWTSFMVDDSAGTAREIPVDSISAVGFQYDESDVTAFVDAVKGYLSNHPDCPIDITGPVDSGGAVALAASGVSPRTLSGSHTILKGIVGGTTPLGLVVGFGMLHYYTNGDPAFGVAVQSATNGYLCTKYTIDGNKYSARFVPYPGSTPSWVDTILT